MDSRAWLDVTKGFPSDFGPVTIGIMFGYQLDVLFFQMLI